MILKASEINNLTDARYFAAWGVHWMGIQAGEHRMSTQQFNEIANWLEGTQIVADFDAAAGLSDIRQYVAQVEAKGVQISSFFQASDLTALPEALIVFQQYVVGKDTDWESVKAQIDRQQLSVDYVVLNFVAQGLSWQSLIADKDMLEKLRILCGTTAVILQISCAPEHIVEMLNELKPAGLQFLGGEEEKVGYKSFDDLDESWDILEAIIYP